MAQATIAEVEQPLQQPLADDFPAPEQRGPGTGKRAFTSKRYGPDREEPEAAQESFFQHLSSLSQTDWESHLIYVYQWDPIVDLTKGGKENKYRKLYSHAVTEESLKKELGSGTYNLRLNQLNQATRKEKTVRQVMLNIFDPDYPPNLPPGGWLDDPRNKEWAWAKPLIEKKWAIPAVVAAAPTGVPEYMVQFMNEVRSELNRRPDLNTNAKDQLMGSIVTILPALLQQQNTASDPTKMIEALVKAKDMMVPAAAAPIPQDNTLITFLLEEVKSMREQTTLLLTKIFEMKTEAVKQPDTLAQVKQMTEIISAVSGFTQPPAAREPWQEVVTELGPKVLSLGENIVTAIGMQNRMRAANPQQPMQQRPPQPQPSGAQPPPIPPNPPQAIGPNPEQPQESHQPEGPQMDPMQRSLLLQVAGLTHNALTLGLAGDQFAEQVCTSIFNDKIYESFIGSVPKDQLLPAFKSIPEAWAVLQQFEPQLPAFIEAFYAYAEPSQDEEPIPELIPEVVSKPNGRGKSKKAN